MTLGLHTPDELAEVDLRQEVESPGGERLDDEGADQHGCRCGGGEGECEQAQERARRESVLANRPEGGECQRKAEHRVRGDVT